MSKAPTIRECYPVTGDWFLVQRWGREGEEDRWFISRVVLWAVVEADGSVQHVRAIDPNGRLSGQQESPPGSFFAYGADRSPVENTTWKELYDRTFCAWIDSREITAALKNWEDRSLTKDGSGGLKTGPARAQ